ncbi:hypothetical protein OS493_007416 [Desmophyllum pertusum]|uniref:Uncharacterized protein n=1 Tax=Desmophyllum pertusum TaxID=174260 RepID=A0A9W9Z2U7_9CNID|nr:hypothetical protein OS493_007416 [Desmophyllum pertusum]
MALKLNPLLVNTDAVKAGRLPVFQRQASTSRGSHFEKTPTPWEVGKYPQFDVVVAIDTFHTEESYGEPNCTNYLGDFLGLVNINPVTIAAGPFCGIIKSPFAVTTRGFKDRRALLYFRTNNGLAFKGFNATYFAISDTSKISVVLDSIESYKVQITWNVSDVAEQIHEFFVFYQQVGEKNIWKFKKTKKQEATILNLQPSTHHKLRVVGYKSSRDVYASDVVLFATLGGLKTTPSAPVPRMYVYGDEAGDKVLPSALKICFKIAIPDIGMQFFSKRHKRLYICPNGVIQFGIKKINQAPYNFGQRHWLKRLPMLASYWAPTDLQSFVDGPSKVFYHAYDKYREPDIRHQKENDVTKTLHNTFQAVIVTDGIFSFVIYNYPHGGIQYSAPANVSRYKRRKDYFVAYKNYKRFPVVGVNSGDKTGNFSNLQRSGTIQIENIDTLVGNAKIPGRNIFRLENSNGEEDGRLKCERWYGAQPRPDSYSDELDPCPCSIIQAVRDERYQWVRPYVPYTEDTLCFYTRFPIEDWAWSKVLLFYKPEKFRCSYHWFSWRRCN